MNREVDIPLTQVRSSTQVDFADMNAFVAVVNAGSFTGAARRLGTSKSVISRRVSDLERQLGARLIERSAARIGPTEVGAEYHAKCVWILESIAAANDLVANHSGSVRGSLRVSVPRFFCAMVVAPLLAEFAGRYPELRLEVDAVERESCIHDTGFDVAIRIGALANSSMLARTISRTSMCICASPAYLEANGEPSSPEDLGNHDGLVYSGDDVQSGWLLQSNCKVRSYRVRERMRGACYMQLFEAARSGLGLACLPSCLVADAVAAGELRIVLCDYTAPPSPVWLVHPASRKHSPGVRALLEFLAQRIPNPPRWEQVLRERTG